MIYVSWRVYLRPSCSGSGNMHFVIFTLVLDICCQQLGDICQLEGVCDSVCPLVFGLRVGKYAFCNILICIVYILPTIAHFQIHIAYAVLSMQNFIFECVYLYL